MTFSTANAIDFGVLIIIGISILIGVLRGATREILGIAGWIGSFATVFYGLPLFRPLGRQYISNPMISDAIVAGLLFILSLAVFIVISRTISSGVKGSMLGGLDRSFGLLFGFARGALIVCLIYIALGFFFPPGQMPIVIQSARFTPWIIQGAKELNHFIPADYLPQDRTPLAINPLDPQDLLESSFPSLEETVKHLSILKPVSPKNTSSQSNEVENLIDQNDSETQR